ncbi:hypothetical protein HMPREF9004_1118 [Schaalia cardiffensis F0333]|uniref:Uncharacterized protein n=1 Tax=Schaalia cardiffensis F0333 TaxID=888050 RepID=N6WDA5_9ACTO|nr:hypothetical protein HMPREF9004_1118 [Schaalia cardiffensis F0333]
MGRALHGGPAQVNPHVSGSHRGEGLESGRFRVVQVQRHALDLSGALHRRARPLRPPSDDLTACPQTRYPPALRRALHRRAWPLRPPPDALFTGGLGLSAHPQPRSPPRPQLTSPPALSRTLPSAGRIEKIGVQRAPQARCTVVTAPHTREYVEHPAHRRAERQDPRGESSDAVPLRP